MLSLRFQRYVASRIRHKFPPCKRGKPQKLIVEHALDAIFKLIRTGMQWREITSKCNSSYSTLNRHFKKWHSADVFQDAYTQLLKQYLRSRSHQPSYYCIDSTFVKNLYGTEGLGRNPTDRGRTAMKLSVLLDDNGVIHSLIASPANIPDVVLMGNTIKATLAPLCRHVPLLADKGYDSRSNRSICLKSGLLDRISRKRCKTGRRMNGKRSIVERCFAWVDKHRRLLLQYERTPAAHIAMVHFCIGNLLVQRFQFDIN